MSKVLLQKDFALIAHTGPVCVHILLLHPSPVPTGDSRKNVYVIPVFQWKTGFLYWQSLSAAPAEELIDTPLGLMRLTNVQSNQSIELEVNGTANICQLQTGLYPPPSSGSSSVKKKDCLRRNKVEGGHYH